MPETGIIILAAGNSARLGRPKQLLEFRGKSLITHLVAEAITAGIQPVVVVSGAVHLSVPLAGQPVSIVENPRWREGMGSSIAAGVRFLSDQAVDAFFVAVCDQPYVSANLFTEMIAAKKRFAKGIVACSYAGTTGTPVLFDRQYFGMLEELTGQEGAKKILRAYQADVAAVPFPHGEIDIDTEDDYEKLSGG
jgi:molybdenum cofactor cytidylyltransferase